MPSDIEDPTSRDTKKPYNVYWNVPTVQCKSKKIPFDNLHEKYGIIQNSDDKFLGERIAILYDPGLFPALLTNEPSGKLKFRNGGVPQEGDLEKHLVSFRNAINQSVPDPEFNGGGAQSPTTNKELVSDHIVEYILKFCCETERSYTN